MDFSIINQTDRINAFFKSLVYVLPEIFLVLAMCAVVIVPLVNKKKVWLPVAVSLGGLLLALISLRMPWIEVLVSNAEGSSAWRSSVEREAATSIFGDMLVIDQFGQFFKFLLIVFSMLVVLQWRLAKKDQCGALDAPDFFCLMLGATFGMCLMASANNLLMIVIATEAASLPSFALAGFRKKQREGAEGALKYVIFGSAASAIMIYGMSLVYGATGTLSLPAVAQAAADIFSAHQVENGSVLLAVGLLAMFAGLAFKLSAVPLHFWCPDVFQAAPISVTTFLSVASKGAAMIMLVRILHAFGMATGEQGVFTGIAVGIGILGAVTATWGNLLAYHQTNIKRMLAYSSISHAGYMIMAASVMIYAQDTASAQGAGFPPGSDVASSILFYLLVYIFMNLGAFTIVALVADRTGSEEIEDYTGLFKRSPILASLMILFLLSLFGMPGLGGFMGKIVLSTAMIKIGPAGFALLAALLINTLISLYYYMKPVYYMVFVKDEQDRPTFPLANGVGLLAVCTIALLWTGLNFFGASKITSEYGKIYSPATSRVEVEAINEPAATGAGEVSAQLPVTSTGKIANVNP